MYLKIDDLKYILPEAITRNKRKAPAQNFIITKTSDFFVLGHEKILDFDNSRNSFVGCCSFGTGQLYSFIKKNYGNARLSPLLQNDSRS